MPTVVVSKGSQKHTAYYSLHYVLLFPLGNDGWHLGIPHNRGRGDVTALEFYSYRLMQWRNEGARAPGRSKGWGPYVQAAKLKTYITTLYRNHISHFVKHADSINLSDLRFYFAFVFFTLGILYIFPERVQRAS